MLQGFCAGLMSEMPSAELTIFNNEQVTCVGARVVGKAMIDRERPCPNFLDIKLIGSKVQLSAKTIRWKIEV